MANEKYTEDLVRSHFKADPLFSIIKFEEQKSMNKRVVDILQGAGKGGKGGVGKPEFLISFPTGNMDYIIVVECKAKPADHMSKNPEEKTPEKAVKFAVDGVLHYAEKLSKEYDVIAIAVSGENMQEVMISNFHWKKGTEKAEELSDKKLLSINDYLKVFQNEQFADNLKNVDIIKKAIELNEEYQAYSITEMTRCTIVSAILVALMNETFRSSYQTHSDSPDVAKALLSAIETVLKKHEVKNKDAMIGEYSKILNEPIFTQNEVKNTKKKDREKSVEVVKEMIRYLHTNVFPLTLMEQNGLDVLGRFYTEFIRYAGGEGGQGLVLTPSHVADLFCDLGNIDKNSVVYDPCCGTGGFLIAAMKRMLAAAGGDEDKKLTIRKHQLVGVELRPSMFTYACSNMMMRGDGKSNIYCGDCFPFENIVRDEHKATVAFLNPPYDVGAAGQMHFIEHALNVVAPQHGTVVAIVQMSVGIKNEKDLIAAKTRVLQNHRLHAVLSMPDDLFSPAATVVTSIMVFKAGEKHDGRKTWFGYFKDDGFEKRKHKGRIDARGKWKAIKEQWVKAYHNLDEISGLSVKAEVGPSDEWCAEAYMETDYLSLTETDFKKKVLNYAAFGVQNGDFSLIQEIISHKCTPILIDIKDWKSFRYDEVFTIEKGYYNKKPDESEDGEIIFVGATEMNNGITSRHTLKDIEDVSKDGSDNNHPISEKIFAGNCITVSNNGSVGNAFYQLGQFTCSHDINVLRSRIGNWNKYSALFVCALIEKEKYRWAYGRKWRPSRMPDSTIKLPVTSSGEPDWQWMEDYIKSLPYSASL